MRMIAVCFCQWHSNINRTRLNVFSGKNKSNRRQHFTLSQKRGELIECMFAINAHFVFIKQLVYLHNVFISDFIKNALFVLERDKSVGIILDVFLNGLVLDMFKDCFGGSNITIMRERHYTMVGGSQIDAFCIVSNIVFFTPLSETFWIIDGRRKHNHLNMSWQHKYRFLPSLSTFSIINIVNFIKYHASKFILNINLKLQTGRLRIRYGRDGGK